MITSCDIAKILEKYDQKKLAIGTLGSHSSLNIFKGAKEEGFRTVCICKEKDAIMYQKYPLVDELIIVKDFTELLNEQMQEKLRRLNVILIPHGSFTAYLSTEELTDSLHGAHVWKPPAAPLGSKPQITGRMAKTSRTTFASNLQNARRHRPPSHRQACQAPKAARGYFLANSPKSFPQEIQ